MNPAAPLRPTWFYRLFALYTGLHVVLGMGLMADFVTHPLAPDPLLQSTVFRWLLAAVLVPVALVVSVLVMRRAPGNISGLCLLLHSVLIMGATLRTGSPLQPYNAALNTAWSGLWVLGLFFPDGRAQPARFGWLVTVLSALSVLSNATLSFFSRSLQLEPGLLINNPIFVEALAPLEAVARAVQQGLLLTVAVLIPPSLVVRYRVSNARGRQQLKWLLWPFVLLILALLPLWNSAQLTGRTDPFDSLGRLPVAAIALFIYAFPLVSVGTAILRNQLYDIDVVVRKTLVYSVLTVLLGLAYFGCIVALEGLFRGVTGQEQAQFVTVLSTLTIAALFVPLRRRVQAWIDRRFYRRKYDASRTLAGFAATARDETDLQHLSAQLVAVVDETMQPESVGLWLKAGRNE